MSPLLKAKWFWRSLWIIFPLRRPQKGKHPIPGRPKSQPTHPFFRSEAISNMWSSGSIVVCVVCNTPPAMLLLPLWSYLGAVWPWVPLLTPKTHSSCLLYHTLFSSPAAAFPSPLSLFTFAIQPFCSASFPFQTNSSRFLSLVIWGKKNFSCVWEQWTTNDSQYVKLVKATPACTHVCSPDNELALL